MIRLRREEEKEGEEEGGFTTFLLGDAAPTVFAVTHVLNFLLVEAAPLLALASLPPALLVGTTLCRYRVNER